MNLTEAYQAEIFLVTPHTCHKNQTKNISFKMIIQNSVIYAETSINFSIYSLLQYIVSVTYIVMTFALKLSNQMQQTASMRLNNIAYDITITVKCVTYYQMYYYLMQVLSLDHKLPKYLQVMRFVDCIF